MSAVSETLARQLPKEHYLNAEYGWKSWLFTVDHKRIAILYLVSITLAFFIGGGYATAIRLEPCIPDFIGHPARLGEKLEADELRRPRVGFQFQVVGILGRRCRSGTGTGRWKRTRPDADEPRRGAWAGNAHAPLPDRVRTDVNPSSSFMVSAPEPSSGWRRNRHHCRRTLGRSGNGTRR